MRRTASASAIDDLRLLIGECIPGEGALSDTEPLVQSVVKWYEAQNTFTDAMHNGNAVKQCPLCKQLCLFYKKTIRSNLVPALRYLASVGRPLTTMELSALTNKESDRRTQSRVAHFPQLRFWGLIRGIDGKKMGERWEITDRGRDFIDGKITLPAFIFTDQNNRIVPTPEGQEGAISVSINELRYDEENDPTRHVEEAVAVLATPTSV